MHFGLRILGSSATMAASGTVIVVGYAIHHHAPSVGHHNPDVACLLWCRHGYLFISSMYISSSLNCIINYSVWRALWLLIPSAFPSSCSK